jgi:hypothetical protein
MPSLRDEVIAIICDEWPKREDRETPLDAETISELLQKAGGSATEAEVQLELEHLAGHHQITLEAEPGKLGPPGVGSVSPELCRIEDVARRLLKAAWRRRISGFSVPDVIAPRDTQVVREIGYEDHTAEELWRVEEWLEDQHYIEPAPIAGAKAPGGFYTVTPQGHAFREGVD